MFSVLRKVFIKRYLVKEFSKYTKSNISNTSKICNLDIEDKWICSIHHRILTKFGLKFCPSNYTILVSDITLEELVELIYRRSK